MTGTQIEVVKPQQQIQAEDVLLRVLMEYVILGVLEEGRGLQDN